MAVNVKMAKELNEDTGFTVSVKTLIAVGFAMATIIGMWFALQAKRTTKTRRFTYGVSNER
jgi:hypothetical protein